MKKKEALLGEEINEEEQTKKSIFDWFVEHPKTTFWSRFVVWAVFACALPFSFIVWRFNLFHKISKIQIGGWGIIAIVILAVFAFTIIRYIKLAFSGRYSLVGQVLGGFCKVIIPLIAAIAILYSVRESVDLMLQVLGCVTLCEFIALPLNPLPKWAYEAQKNVRVEERKETADYILDGFFKRKKEEKSGE